MPEYIVDIFISGKGVFWIIVRPPVVIVIRRISFDDCNAKLFHHCIVVKGLLAPGFSFALVPSYVSAGRQRLVPERLEKCRDDIISRFEA